MVAAGMHDVEGDAAIPPTQLYEYGTLEMFTASPQQFSWMTMAGLEQVLQDKVLVGKSFPYRVYNVIGRHPL